MESSQNEKKPPRGLLYGIGALILVGLGASLFVIKNSPSPDPASAGSTPMAQATPTEAVSAEAAANPNPTAESASTNTTDPLSVDDQGLSKATAVIETEKGKIKFKFYSKDAPATVGRIMELIRSGFYNGLTFHRVVPGFVIQGGDPNGNGTGGSGKKLKAEFNSRKHVLGTVAMARAQDPDSADSQFYIALGDIPHLDGNYTVFGQVVEGIETVKKIAIGDKMTRVSID